MAHLSANERLLWALIENNEEIAVKALEDGADFNLSSPTGSRPLHVAAFRGLDSIINILLNEATVDQADIEGFTPLMVAALNGKTNAVRVFLAKEADPNKKRLDTGETALHLAMKSGSQEVVKALLDGGADINAQTNEDINAQTNALAQPTHKFTPLHFAALFDARDLAYVLLDDPLCEAATRDSQGRTAAMVARDEGHICLAEHLDMCTMKRSKVDQELVSAVMELEDDAARRALAAGANANLSSPTGSSLLHAAALRGSASLVNIFLEHGIKVDQADCKGFTPLMIAALNGRTDVVRTLLENGANTNRKRLNTGETALHMSMDGESPEVVKALLEGKADINAQTTDDMFTPLHFAALCDAPDLMEILQTDSRCDVTITDSKGRTAAQLAKESGNEVRVQQDTLDGSMTNVQVNCTKPMEPSEFVYKITSVPRGRVLVLNYEKFKNQRYRSGAVWDAQKLGNLFAKMGYDVSDVKMSRNLGKEETEKVLKSFRDNKEMEKVDCVVVCVLSHGMNRNIFMTSDDELMTVEEVYDFFKDDLCPNLKDKPKLFLFNFCRKHYPDEPRSVRRSDDASPTKTILKDFVSLYACQEGNEAKRNVWKGTYFAEAVMKIFAKHAHNLPVDELYEKVNKYMKTELMGPTMAIDRSNTSKKFYLNPTRERKATPQHSS